MDVKKAALATACGMALVVLTTGCFFNDPVLSGGTKVAAGQMTTLNAAEVQALANLAIEQSGQDVDPLTQDEAAVVVQFIRDNNINTVQDLQALAENPDDVIITDEVKDALEAITGESFDQFDSSES